MVGVGADAGDHLGVSCLHGAQRPSQRHDAAGAAERNMVEPAYREPEMLGEPDSSVRSQREAADAQAVDVGLVELRSAFNRRRERRRDEPMCVADGIADVRDRHRRDERQIAIVSRADASRPLEFSRDWTTGDSLILNYRGTPMLRIRLPGPRAALELPQIEGLAARHGARAQFLDLRPRQLLRCGLRQGRAKTDESRRLVIGERLTAMACRRVALSRSPSGPDAAPRRRTPLRRGSRPAPGRRRMRSTSGCAWSALSTSTAAMFSPLRRIVLRTVDEEKGAVVALPHQVSGMEPAAGPRLARRRLVLVVAGKKSAPWRFSLRAEPTTRPQRPGSVSFCASSTMR